MTRDLKQRIAFTLGALLVWRVGVYLPVPGIDPQLWADIFRGQPGSIWQQYNFLSGGVVRFLGICSLGIMPYVTAALLIQLLTLLSSAVNRLKQKGERGRVIISRCTLAVTLFLAAWQAYGVAVGLEGASVVSEPGLLFRVSTVLTLTGGTIFLVWLSQQITARGVGNGIAIILFAGIATELPREIPKLIVSNQLGVLTSGILLALVLVIVAVAALVVMMERARRCLPVRFAERQAGTRMLPGRSADLVLKLNPAGIMPAILTSWLASMVFIVVSLAAWLAGKGGGWIGGLPFGLGYGTPLHLLLWAAVIVFFAFVYTAFVCDPDDMAEKLEKHGGALPEVASGDAAAHLDHVISRTAAIGATYLALVILLPEILISYSGAPFYFPSTSLLIMVCATLDIEAQVRAERRLPPG
jgi:preprotein translocase subunit SecY